jgi:hypothetical protein
MTTGAVLAAALTDHSAHPFSLLLNGEDIIKGISGKGVPIESVSISERGPNGIDSMEFRLDDPGKVYALAGGEEIVLWDNVTADPLFGGYLETYDEVAGFGQQGRYWDCRALGYSATLDRILVASETRADNLASATAGENYRIHNWIQQLIGTYTPWRNGAGAWTPTASTQANPIGSDTFHVSWAGPWKGYTVSLQTLRQAIETIRISEDPQDINIRSNFDYFVDFYRGFRLYSAATVSPSDIPNMGAAPFNVSDAGPKYARNLTYSLDLSGVVNRVYSKGPTLARWVQDDASVQLYGRRERTAPSASDVDIDLLNYGLRALRPNPTIRGSYETRDVGLHVGFTQTITNAAEGLVALPITIGEVRTRFLGGTNRTHEITFGGTVDYSSMQAIQARL